eukprot:CAMPEP_0185900958 /NCGR_PEP_ID=MMETSP0196C-20130402/384_1 /TAXON_ID=2932 /ORGANISM="Alexandrium fundyense, Strain CCMP1719" /LENGTH=44 /DNA_ID= /DNA_START= /DNA_END= /DNA_ORIENTATION=
MAPITFCMAPPPLRQGHKASWRTVSQQGQREEKCADSNAIPTGR